MLFAAAFCCGILVLSYVKSLTPFFPPPNKLKDSTGQSFRLHSHACSPFCNDLALLSTGEGTGCLSFQKPTVTMEKAEGPKIWALLWLL